MNGQKNKKSSVNAHNTTPIGKSKIAARGPKMADGVEKATSMLFDALKLLLNRFFDLSTSLYEKR